MRDRAGEKVTKRTHSAALKDEIQTKTVFIQMSSSCVYLPKSGCEFKAVKVNILMLYWLSRHVNMTKNISHSASDRID